MNKHLHYAIMLLLLLHAFWAAAQNYTIEKWYNGKKSATVLTFDDWSPGHGPIAVPGLKSKGLIGSFYITTNNVNSYQPIQQAAQDGNEIGNHTKTHPYLSTVSAAQLVQEITDVKTYLETQLPGVKIQTFVYPHGDYNDATIDEVKKQHFAARAYVEPVPANISFPYDFAPTDKDYYTVNTVPVDANLTPALFGSRVQQAIGTNGLLTFTIHSINNATVNDTWWDPITETHYLSLLDELLKYKAQTWITTFRDAIKYHKERRSAALTTVSNTADEWVLNLTDNLADNSLYNHPLTVKLKKGTGENYVAVTQNGTNVSFSYTTGGDSIIFNAIPDGGNIRLNKGTGVTLNITAPANNATFQGLAAISLSATAVINGATITSVNFTIGSQTIAASGTNPYTATWTPAAYGTYTVTANAAASNGKTAQAQITINVVPVPTCTIPAWNATTAYSSGAQVSYLGRKYTANWWNQNAKPSENSGSGQAWTDNGVCGSSNVKPTVSFTAPANNTTYNNLNPISVSVNAADADGSVASVKYSFTGQADKVVTGSNPFTTSFTPTAYGTYTITAVATDNLGLSSDPVTITVITAQTPGNVKPTVSITAPANNTTFTNLNPISISVNAADTDGSVASVKYSFTGQADKVVTGANPFATSFTPTANGTYTITAVATDNLGLTSDPATITVVVNQTSGGCTAPQYVAGTTYATGAFVQNQGNKYQCTVGGWCSSSSSYYYAPGTGTAWQSAWSLIGPCTSRMAAEAAASVAFSMYPNPTDGKLSFHVNTEEISTLQVSIINNYGAEVSVQRISVNESLDMASLPQGLYTIKVTAGDFVWTERIVRK